MIWSVCETPQPAATGAHSTAGMGEEYRQSGEREPDADGADVEHLGGQRISTIVRRRFWRCLQR